MSKVTPDEAPPPKNPRRVAAGKRNRALNKGLTEKGRQKLREAVLKNRPFDLSTGPKTEKGKAKVAQNGCYRQAGEPSLRSLRATIRRLKAEALIAAAVIDLKRRSSDR